MSYPIYPADPNRDPAEPFRRLDTAPTAVMTSSAPRHDPWDDVVEPQVVSPEELAERQRQAFGGPKIGAAFFGWLVSFATAATLTGLVVGADLVLGFDVVPDPWASRGIGPLDALTVGWVVVGAMLAIVLVSFYCGGYVAGRMARFSGAAQGVVVWVWAAVVAGGAVFAAALLGDRAGLVGLAGEVLARVPIDAELRAVAGIVAAAATLVVTLGGAVLGGVVGVRYHRRVDRAGLVD
ncbi:MULTISPECIES: hypothetical protein [unclassified Agromyces]|uniref:hypothetical protein n=1 Tax=unclassified Agromyces TaxID=2639701 RepID=UPI003014B28C